MSTRTIVEFNHDLAGTIGDRFLLALARALTSGSDDDWAALNLFGVKRICRYNEPDIDPVAAALLERIAADT